MLVERLDDSKVGAASVAHLRDELLQVPAEFGAAGSDDARPLLAADRLRDLATNGCRTGRRLALEAR
eukprot:4746875-Prymnesium_polylepis.1